MNVKKNDALKRYQDFEKWMWKDCVNSSVIFAMKYGKKRDLQLLSTCDYYHDVYSFEDNHFSSVVAPRSCQGVPRNTLT